MDLRLRLRLEAHRLVLVCTAGLLVIQFCAYAYKPLRIDDTFVAPAAALLRHGVFADRASTILHEAPAPGRSVAPGYPAIIAATAALDARAYLALDCIAMGHSACLERGQPFRLLILLQMTAGLIALGLAYALARTLSGSAEIASAAALLMLMMGRLSQFSVLVLPYAVTTALALGVCTLLLVSYRRRSIAVTAAAGLLLGGLALIDVYYAALALLIPPLLLAAEWSRPNPSYRFAAAGAVVVPLTAGFVFAPWMVRNYLMFGDAAPIDGWGARLLAERMAYSGLRPGELLAGFICWLPGVGDLASLVLAPQTVRKFDLYYEGSLLLNGERLLAATPPTGDVLQFRRLFQLHALVDPLGYAASSALLVLRGLRATGGFLVLWGFLAIPLLLRRLRAAERLGSFVVVAGPLMGLAVVQALLTSNLPWMNLPLVFVYAYAIAEIAGGLELPLGLRRMLRAESEGSPYDAGGRAAVRP